MVLDLIKFIFRNISLSKNYIIKIAVISFIYFMLCFLISNENFKCRELHYATIHLEDGLNIKEKFKEFGFLAKIIPLGPQKISYNDKTNEERTSIVDNDIFKIFDIKIIKGDIINPLDKPYTAVITEQIALKYFGSKDPIGELIRVNNSNYIISAIIKHYAWNSEIRIDVMLSWPIENNFHKEDLKSMGFMHIYIKPKNNFNKALFKN